ncbi:hypothetical protein JAAARDRAFT_38274 [Jaapia argillacea MUCL 33604]|uniref:Beta-lactamase-related domain-containing protein n=1 Tax=Jaapia argillacea MUCL 33604 TaxID=933084 RepID=A0A067PW60_9AGAM|nr:hypothetical protein JAAARDRAFT_38274 [Jaapia argillacea MUCL 33604]
MLLSFVVQTTLFILLAKRALRVVAEPNDAQIPLSLALSSVTSSPQSLLSPDFDLYVEEIRKNWNVPGISVSVVKVVNDSFYASPIIETRSYGVAHEDGRPVTASTVFGIGSNSKLVAAAALGSLVDAGHVNWTTRIRDILPEFGLLDDYDGGLVTIRDALSHRTGLPRHDYSYQGLEGSDSLEDAISRIKYLKPSAEFRDVLQYNNLMYMTAARIVEKLTGTTFREYVATHLFSHPALKMSATSYAPSYEENDHLSSGFGNYPSNGSAFVYPFQLSALIDGAGGVYTNAFDIAKWMAFLIKSRRRLASPLDSPYRDEDTPVSPQSISTISSGYTVWNDVKYPEVSTVVYGHAVGQYGYQGQNIWKHGGTLPGFGSQVSWAPDAGVGVAVMCNTAGTGNAAADIISFRALEELAGMKLHPDWNGRYQEIHNKTSLVDLRSVVTSGPMDFDLNVVPSQRRPSIRLPLVHEAPPTTNLSRYIGTYADPGYGAVVICPLPEAAHLYANISKSCDTLYSSIKNGVSIAEEHPSPSPFSFLITFRGTWVGYIYARHISGTEFTGTVCEIVAPAGKRTWPILNSGQRGEIGINVQFNQSVGLAETMEWWGLWGAGEGVVEEEGRVEVMFKREV